MFFQPIFWSKNINITAFCIQTWWKMNWHLICSHFNPISCGMWGSFMRGTTIFFSPRLGKHRGAKWSYYVTILPQNMHKIKIMGKKSEQLFHLFEFTLQWWTCRMEKFSVMNEIKHLLFQSVSLAKARRRKIEEKIIRFRQMDLHIFQCLSYFSCNSINPGMPTLRQKQFISMLKEIAVVLSPFTSS